MAGLGEWLVMSRHERRGALAMLLLIVVAVAALWLARHRTIDAAPDERLQMMRLERQADSLAHAADAEARQPKVAHKMGKDTERNKRKGNKRATKQASRKSPAPERPLEPVPQITD